MLTAAGTDPSVSGGALVAEVERLGERVAAAKAEVGRAIFGTLGTRMTELAVLFDKGGTSITELLDQRGRAIIGGLTAVHQFCRIGTLAITGGCTKIVQDVPPFFIADGNPAEVRGVNAVGLDRAGVGPETVRALREAYRLVYRSNLNTAQAVERLSAEFGERPEVQALVAFITTSKRGIVR